MSAFSITMGKGEMAGRCRSAAESVVFGAALVRLATAFVFASVLCCFGGRVGTRILRIVTPWMRSPNARCGRDRKVDHNVVCGQQGRIRHALLKGPHLIEVQAAF